MARRVPRAKRARRAKAARPRPGAPRNAISDSAAHLVETAHLALVGELAGALAHELGGPAGALALLVGELDEALAGRAAPEELGPIVRDVGTCSERLSALVRLIRRISRRDSWASSVDLAPVVADAVAIARIRAKGSSVEFSMRAESAHVAGAPGRLEALALALAILAVDACRAAPPPSGRHHVDVALFGEEGFAVLRISHDVPASAGASPPPGDATRPFATDSESGADAAVALHALFFRMASEIAREAGGTLGFDPGVDAGGAFEARLPLATPSPSGEGERARARRAG